jgi:polyisoprenyl-teichoic acid--peptidoglycan teichoic acid transferase
MAVAVGLVAVIVAGLLIANRPSEAPVAAAPSASPSPTPSPSPSPSPTPTPAPSPSATPAAPIGPDPVLGSDGRLTVLLLGSDARAGQSGNRTDVMMVVSLDPTTGAVAAASIPRDTANFPTSSKGRYGPKVNGLYQALIGRLGQPKAAGEMKRIVGSGIGVEVDSYAVIGFEGVRQLVNAVGGVDVVLTKSVSDPYYWVTSSKRGVFFPAGRNHLSGDRALIFARTRKGDNDFERARRQQLLVAGAVQAVRDRGLRNLTKLIGVANRYIKTDLPLAAAPVIFDMVSGAKVTDAERVVFGPTKWASGASGTSFSLRLDAVRAWTAAWMAPVKTIPTPAPRTTPVPEGVAQKR